MRNSKQKAEGSKPVYGVKTEKDVSITMRDRISLAADVYRPNAKGKFPALLAYGPYGKELQALVLTFPPRRVLVLYGTVASKRAIQTTSSPAATPMSSSIRGEPVNPRGSAPGFMVSGAGMKGGTVTISWSGLQHNPGVTAMWAWWAFPITRRS